MLSSLTPSDLTPLTDRLPLQSAISFALMKKQYWNNPEIKAGLQNRAIRKYVNCALKLAGADEFQDRPCPVSPEELAQKIQQIKDTSSVPNESDVEKSEADRERLQRSLDFFNNPGNLLNENDLNIAKIATDPNEALKFKIFAGLSNLDPEKARIISDIRRMGEPERALTEKYADKWRNLTKDETEVIYLMLNEGKDANEIVLENFNLLSESPVLKLSLLLTILRIGERETKFIKENFNQVDELGGLEIIKTRNILTERGPVTDFIINHFDQWRLLNDTQMNPTIGAIQEGGAPEVFLKNHFDQWRSLDRDEMNETRRAIEGGGASEAFVKENFESWRQLNSVQMSFTKDIVNLSEKADQYVKECFYNWSNFDLDILQTIRKALTEDPIFAKAAEKNLFEFFNLTVDEMKTSIQAFNNQGAAAKFITKTFPEWERVQKNEHAGERLSLKTKIKNQLKKMANAMVCGAPASVSEAVNVPEAPQANF